jgi:hypothetical protein
MRVRMFTKKENDGMRIACRVEGGNEVRMIERILKNEKWVKKMLSKVGEINKLGMYLHAEFDGIDSEFLNERFVSVPEEIISKENMKEITDFVAKYLADLLDRAIDVPELHETIATVEVPEDVKEKLSKYGIDADFRIDFIIEKEPGFSTVFIRRDEVDVKDDRLRKVIYKSLQFNNLFNVEFGSITGFDDEIHIFSDRKKEVIILVDNYIDEGFDELKKKVKKIVREQVKNIRESGAMNLLLAAIYNPLDYHAETIKIFDEPSDPDLGEYVISNLKITRDTVFDYADIELRLETPMLKDIYGRKKCPVTLDISGNKVKMEVYPSISRQRIESFVNEDVHKRVDRLEKGDLSVIKEIEDFDKTLVNVLPELLRDKIIECLVENNIVLKTADGYNLNDEFRIKRPSNTSSSDTEIEVESDVLDAMPKEKQEKLITFLVAQRFKKSAGV